LNAASAADLQKALDPRYELRTALDPRYEIILNPVLNATMMDLC
jgi:hypothetical protein